MITENKGLSDLKNMKTNVGNEQRKREENSLQIKRDKIVSSRTRAN